jgi:hypothetical protein
VSKYPRTDAARLKDVCRHMAMAEECTRMEYELNEAKDRIKQLEEAGDKLTLGAAAALMWSEIEAWNKAKEAKP